MKTITMMAVTLILLFAVAATALSQATVVSVRGDVQVRRGAEESWRPLAVGDVVKPEDSMLSGKRASAVLSVGGTRLTLPEMVIVDCADLRVLTQEELLLKLAMEGIRALPQQKRGSEPTIPRTTTVHGGASDELAAPAGADGTQRSALQLNGTKVLHAHGFYATMVLRAKEVLRLAPELRRRSDVRLLVADAFERMRLSSEALAEYRSLDKERLTPAERSLVERKIAELRKKQKG